MPLLTPECLWCGKKWVVSHATRVCPVQTFRPPATSTRWPSIHLHFECAREFLSALWDETGVDVYATCIGKELEDKRGRDHNFPLKSQYYEPRFWRHIRNESIEAGENK